MFCVPGYNCVFEIRETKSEDEGGFSKLRVTLEKTVLVNRYVHPVGFLGIPGFVPRVSISAKHS